MGSFRSPAARKTEGTRTLRSVDRPPGVAEEDWLAEGELVVYWWVMPHGARSKVDAASQQIAYQTVDGKTTGVHRFTPVDAGVAKLVHGIYAFEGMTDERGHPVRWDAGLATELLDGLPGPVLSVLGLLIDAGSRPRLSDPADPADPEGPTEGEA